MTRLPYLDYLRGLAAFLIMVYHFILFTGGLPPANSFLTKTGFYGVSVFYVLSGLTLFHVNRARMKPDRQDLVIFFLKRFFRIFPLLWLATFATIIMKGWPGWGKLLLNLTGLFGLVNPAAYIGTGVWSIGNELVFYLFFPFFIFLLNRSRLLFYTLAFLLFAIYAYFTFVQLPAFGAMPAAWTTYINPLNQVFLFLGGILIGLLSPKKVNQPFLIGLLAVSLLIYTFYPVTDTPLALVVGKTRMAYTFLSIVFVFCFYKFTYELPQVLNKPLHILGGISYSLYLLHPLVLFGIETTFSKLIGTVPAPDIIILSMIASLLISFIVFNYFERPINKLGEKIIRKWIVN
jgi:peptidoglycan/LPS O-acetylase OafA/YrhL